MTLPGWTKSVYAAQLLTGAAAVGGIFADGQVTNLRLFVALIVIGSIAVSVAGVSQAEADAERTRSYLETLLRSMALPYSIVRQLTDRIAAVAKDLRWTITRQENWSDRTVYDFEQADGDKGRLVVADAEFKEWLLLDRRTQTDTIRRRLFGPSDPSPRAVQEDVDLIGHVVRDVLSEHVSGPFKSRLVPRAGGHQFTLETAPSGPSFVVLDVSPSRLEALRAMLPLARYEAVATEVLGNLRSLTTV
jgi:hypothetical protein